MYPSVSLTICPRFYVCMSNCVYVCCSNCLVSFCSAIFPTLCTAAFSLQGAVTDWSVSLFVFLCPTICREQAHAFFSIFSSFFFFAVRPQKRKEKTNKPVFKTCVRCRYAWLWLKSLHIKWHALCYLCMLWFCAYVECIWVSQTRIKWRDIWRYLFLLFILLKHFFITFTCLST